jgi:ATP-dependent protease ClpP protease subunit
MSLKFLLKILALITLISTPTLSYSGPIKEYTLDPKNTLVISGTIGNNILIQATELYQKAQQDGVKQIDILIESPGGNVITGFMFINIMEAAQAKGIKINCVVPSFAASMAFVIAAKCDKLITFKRTFLLFHPMAINYTGRITKEVATLIKDQFEIIEGELDAILIERMRIDPVLYQRHNLTETLWTAQALQKVTKNFITIVDSIKGVPAIINLNNREGFDGKKTKQFNYDAR